MTFLLLTPEQADEVRGPTVSGALEPRETTTGYALPLAVLTDDHSPHNALLASLPQGEVTWLEDPEE